MNVPPVVQEAMEKALIALEFANKRIPELEARIDELETAIREALESPHGEKETEILTLAIYPKR